VNGYSVRIDVSVHIRLDPPVVVADHYAAKRGKQTSLSSVRIRTDLNGTLDSTCVGRGLGIKDDGTVGKRIVANAMVKTADLPTEVLEQARITVRERVAQEMATT
jgi:hypothetical protein